MRIEKLRRAGPRRGAAVAGAAALALALGAPGAASAQTPAGPVGDVEGFLTTALTKKEGCDYPGAVVVVIAQISREAVYGCGYFEDDPAHPNYPKAG